jgi:hypothetical protein
MVVSALRQPLGPMSKTSNQSLQLMPLCGTAELYTLGYSLSCK